MRVLLLGGTGAMGGALKEILSKRGDIVYITSRSVHEDTENIHYLQGNAHDDNFMSRVLENKYDVIVDFMIWGSDEFKVKADHILNATGHYIFTSSSRVYADSVTPITEDSPRLLDVCRDKDYLKTDEYALAKAREENVLFESSRKNWTIIRPYITYNSSKLQLGGYEKQVWLYRALHGRSIPLPKDIAQKKTTMTYGGDAAKAISFIVGNESTLGEVFNIIGNQSMKWGDVLDIYRKSIAQAIGSIPSVYAPETSLELSNVTGNSYQIRYDRLYNRVFENKKIIKLCDGSLEFVPMDEGLKLCLLECASSTRWMGEPNYKLEAYINRRTNEKMSLREYKGFNSRLKYVYWRYCENFINAVK